MKAWDSNAFTLKQSKFKVRIRVQIASIVGSALATWLAKCLKVLYTALPFSLMGGLSSTRAALLLTLPHTKSKATFETIDQLLGVENRGKKVSMTLKTARLQRMVLFEHDALENIQSLLF